MGREGEGKEVEGIHGWRRTEGEWRDKSVKENRGRDNWVRE